MNRNSVSASGTTNGAVLMPIDVFDLPLDLAR